MYRICNNPLLLLYIISSYRVVSTLPSTSQHETQHREYDRIKEAALPRPGPFRDFEARSERAVMHGLSQ
jgi:hypothetical protein